MDIFQTVGVPIISRAFEGYNGCLFAYGQTGSGKTYTMSGDRSNPGVIPLLCEALFLRAVNEECVISVSYVEVYKEAVRDLLVKAKSPAALLASSSTSMSTTSPTRSGDPAAMYTLSVVDDPFHGPKVRGAIEVDVATAADALRLLDEGNRVRETATTQYNATSSRSHAVFTLTLKSRHAGSAATHARVVLVDLAGSERGVGIAGDALREESSKINRSLLFLGQLVDALAKQSNVQAPTVEGHGPGRRETSVPGRSTVVNYRQSVLTRLLRDCLGGNSCTYLCATVSPSPLYSSETYNTLEFAQKALSVQNKAVRNVCMADAHVADQESRLQRMRDDLLKAGDIEREGLRQQLAGEQLQLEKLKAERDMEQKQWSLAKQRSEGERVALMKEIQHHRDTISDLEARVAQSGQLQRELASRDAALGELAARNNHVSAAHNVAQEELERLRALNVSLESELRAVKSERDALRTEVGLEKMTSSQRADANDDLRRRLAEAEAAAADAQRSRDATVVQLRERARDDDAERSLLHEQLEASQADAAELRAQMVTLRESLSAATAAHAAAEALVESLQEEVSVAVAETSEARTAATTAAASAEQAAREEMERVVQQLTQQLHVAEAERARVEAIVEQVVVEKQAAVAESERAAAEIATVVAEKSKLEEATAVIVAERQQAIAEVAAAVAEKERVVEAAVVAREQAVAAAVAEVVAEKEMAAAVQAKDEAGLREGIEVAVAAAKADAAMQLEAAATAAADMRALIAQLQSEAATSDTRLRSTTAQLAEAVAQAEVLRGEVAAARTRSEAAETTSRALTAHNAAINVTIEELRTLHATTVADKGAAEARAAAAVSEAECTATEMTSLRELLAHARARAASAEADAERLASADHHREQVVRTLEGELATLQRRLADDTVAAGERTRDLQTGAARAAAAADERVADLERIRARLAGEVATLEAAATRAKEESAAAIREAVADASRSRSLLEEVRATVATRAREAEAAEARESELRRRVASLEGELSSWDGQLRALHDDHERTRATAAAAAAEAAAEAQLELRRAEERHAAALDKARADAAAALEKAEGERWDAVRAARVERDGEFQSTLAGIQRQHAETVARLNEAALDSQCALRSAQMYSEQASGRAEELTKRVTDLTSQLASKDAANHRMEGSERALQLRVDDLTAQLKTSQATIADLRTRATAEGDGLGARVRELELAVAARSRELADKDGALARTAAEAVRACEDAAIARERLVGERADADACRRRTSGELAELGEKLRIAQQEARDAAETGRTAAEARRAADAELAAMRSEVTRLEQSVQRLADEAKEAAQRLETQRLRADVQLGDALRAAAAEKEAAGERLRTTVAQLTREHEARILELTAASKREIAQAHTERDEAHAEVLRLEMAASAAATAEVQAAAAAAAERARRADVEDARRVAEAAMARALEAAEDATAAADRHAAQVAHLDGVVERLRAQVAAAEGEARASAAEAARLEASATAAEGQLLRANGRALAAEEQRDDHAARAAALAERAAALSDEVEGLRAQQAEAEGQLEELLEALAAREGERTYLHETCATTQAQVKTVTDDRDRAHQWLQAVVVEFNRKLDEMSRGTKAWHRITAALDAFALSLDNIAIGHPLALPPAAGVEEFLEACPHPPSTGPQGEKERRSLFASTFRRTRGSSPGNAVPAAVGPAGSAVATMAASPDLRGEAADRLWRAALEMRDVMTSDCMTLTRAVLHTLGQPEIERLRSDNDRLREELAIARVQARQSQSAAQPRVASPHA